MSPILANTHPLSGSHQLIFSRPCLLSLSLSIGLFPLAYQHIPSSQGNVPSPLIPSILVTLLWTFCLFKGSYLQRDFSYPPSSRSSTTSALTTSLALPRLPHRQTQWQFPGCDLTQMAASPSASFLNHFLGFPPIVLVAPFQSPLPAQSHLSDLLMCPFCSPSGKAFALAKASSGVLLYQP